MATTAPLTQRVERTPAAVAAVASDFRGDVERLLEPGGINRNNVAAVATWIDHPVWDLLDANDAVLHQWATGDLQ